MSKTLWRIWIKRCCMCKLRLTWRELNAVTQNQRLMTSKTLSTRVRAYVFSSIQSR
jgi:hypothetical protein